MIPNGVVVVPTFRRPEMLAICLERISAAEESRDLDIRIFLDHSFPERLNDVEWVRDRYCQQADIYHANPHITCPSGSWNILHSLRAGWETKAPMIYFVEEDVMIDPKTFFKKHLELQSAGDYFVTSGRVLPNFDDTFYSNPGSAYRSEKLARVIPHIRNEYFANQKGYIEQHFKYDPSGGVLDDGLIRHVMASVNGWARCAVPSIASHIGFRMYGKTAEYRVEGTIEEKIAGLRIMLPKISPAGRYTRDFEPFPAL